MQLGEEKCRIERPGNAAIWALSWNNSKDEPSETLCVTDWNQTLSFYNLAGQLLGKERNIGFNGIRVRYFPKSEFVLVCGTNKACSMFTREGIKLGMVGEQQNSWMWCCDIDPRGNFVVSRYSVLNFEIIYFLLKCGDIIYRKTN